MSSTVIVASIVSLTPISHKPVAGSKLYPGGHWGIVPVIVLVVKKWFMLGKASSGCQSWKEIHAFDFGS